MAVDDLMSVLERKRGWLTQLLERSGAFSTTLGIPWSTSKQPCSSESNPGASAQNDIAGLHIYVATSQALGSSAHS